MILTLDRARASRLADPIETLVAEHGALRVLSAAILATLRRRTPRAPPAAGEWAMNAHMRRDIGLGPAAEKPQHWALWY